MLHRGLRHPVPPSISWTKEPFNTPCPCSTCSVPAPGVDARRRVPPGGIEPPTHGLGNRCSSPLSYEGEDGADREPSRRSTTPSLRYRQRPRRGRTALAAAGPASYVSWFAPRRRGVVWTVSE